MELKDRIEGEIYYYSNSNWNNDYIEIFKSPYQFIRINKNNINDTSWNGLGWVVGKGQAGNWFRNTTQEEKDWFNACLKQNKLVDRDSIKSNSPQFKDDKIDNDFKVDDWVVFLSEKAKGTDYYTPCWCKPYVLQISEIENDFLKFSKERMDKTEYKNSFNGGSNLKYYFRKAFLHEIPIDLKIRTVFENKDFEEPFIKGYIMSIDPITNKNELKFQDPVIIKSKQSKKSKLIII